jgi:hypothetical protein
MSTVHPVGVISKQIWIKRRIKDLEQAISRFSEAGLDAPDEWRNELAEHVKNRELMKGKR